MVSGMILDQVDDFGTDGLRFKRHRQPFILLTLLYQNPSLFQFDYFV